MKSVRLHVNGRGTVWLLAQCSRCGQIHKYLAADAATKDTPCQTCSQLMQLSGAVMDDGLRVDGKDDPTL